MRATSAGATLPPLRWRELALLFGVPTLLNLVACRIAIPALDRRGRLPIEVHTVLGAFGFLALALGAVH